MLTFLDHYLFSMWLCACMLEIFVCLRNWMFGVLMSFFANVLCVLLCSRTLHAYVLGGLALVVGVLVCFLLYTTSVVKSQKLLHEKAWIYCYIDCSFCILILIQFRKLHFGILHIYINFLFGYNVPNNVIPNSMIHYRRKQVTCDRREDTY